MLPPMSTFTFTSVADVWPVGTSVSAYLPGTSPAGGTSGSALATAAVASDGSLIFTGLADDTRYVATDGTRSKKFRTSPVVGGSSSAWKDLTVYKAGQVVSYADGLYSAKADFTSGAAFDVTKWTPVADRVPLDLQARVPQGIDLALPGVLGPAGASPGNGSAAPLVAGTEYRSRCVVPRTMKLASISFNVRIAGADDATFVALRDSQGNLLATRATGATGVINSTGRKTVAFDTAVTVEAGSIVYACILIPTFGGTTPQLWSTNPATASGFQMGGITLGTQDGGAKTGLSTPPATMLASDTSTFLPQLFVNDAWGMPIRAWENAALTSIAPFLFFNGLDAPSQLSFVTDTVRTAGTRSAKCLVRSGDVQAATSNKGERCEVGQLPYNEQNGDAFWYAWSTYIPSNWTHTTELLNGNTLAWAIIMQIQTLLSTAPGPPVSINFRPDGIYLDLAGGMVSGSGLVTDLWERQLNRVADATLGVWHDFVMRVEYGASGSVDLFHKLGSEQDFQRIAKRRGIPTVMWANGDVVANAGTNYAKVGLYRSASTFTSTLYQAGLRRGRSLSDVVGIFGQPQAALA